MTDERQAGLREATAAIERDRVDSLDSPFTQLPKGTVNMVIDLIETALVAQVPAQEERLSVGRLAAAISTANDKAWPKTLVTSGSQLPLAEAVAAEYRALGELTRLRAVAQVPAQEERLDGFTAELYGDLYSRVIARIRQRQSLFRLAFDDRRVTRATLRAQAEEFERWLATLDPKEARP